MFDYAQRKLGIVVSLFLDILRMQALIVEVSLRTVGASQSIEMGSTYFQATLCSLMRKHRPG